MEPIRVVHYGLGPIGLEIANLVGQRQSLQSVAAADVRDEILGKTIRELAPSNTSSAVVSDAKSALATPADVVIHCTGSSLATVADQLLECIAAGRSVVSTCEELSYPYRHAPELATRIDEAASVAGVGVIGTGVNPGFAMDYLPVAIAGACKSVSHVAVHRVQDASVRRQQLQDKVGAGLTREQFEQRAKDGSVRHVGLPESAEALAAAFGWELTRLEDTIEPVIAERETPSGRGLLAAGAVTGVRQTVKAFAGSEERVRLLLEMAVGLPEPKDEIALTGDPDIRMLIPGGLHGDIATAAVVVNVIPRLLAARPGLRVMADLAPPRP